MVPRYLFSQILQTFARSHFVAVMTLMYIHALTIYVSTGLNST